MIIRIVSILAALLLFCYLAFVAFFFKEIRQEGVCRELVVAVKDSLDKHFVTETDLVYQLKQANLNPINKPLSAINTDEIEKELLKNEMIAGVEAYKTPAGTIQLNVRQKNPILRILGEKGNFYVDHQGNAMPVSRRYVVHVPLASGNIEKEFAVTELYKFALFLQENTFWNSQIDQLYVHPNGDVELIPRVGDYRIMLGSFENFEEKLQNLLLYYEQAVPKVGWEKYSMINLKYKNQIVCTKK